MLAPHPSATTKTTFLTQTLVRSMPERCRCLDFFERRGIETRIFRER
ncbi:hypothetical protein DOE51_17550 [Bdellovibrio sp. NC01]|nr:hypothetical protein DOE51_17550 [Bdellovibrio sp. NC01]